MPIKPVVRTVYLAPTKGRHYMAKAAAIKAEARALILQRHPSEPPEHDVGMNGWIWQYDLPRADVLLRRVCRLIKKSTPPAPGTEES